MAWVEDWERLAATRDAAGRLKAAEAWIKDTEQQMRLEAFEPIKQAALHTWSQLRQRSNVDLVAVDLVGTTTNRRVELGVTVDGQAGDALGVMSQGELHALALSLFLPRMLRADGPFRFLVLDDPVQAMDPAKVDGLALVLADAARTHQVVVFTHDTRLPAAARRLGIAARHVEVERRPGSVVELREVDDPTRQALADARHVLNNQRDLGDELARRVVPGLCRVAVEAAARDRAWRRLVAQGRDPESVERALEGCHTLHEIASLAVFGESHLHDKLFERLNRQDRRLVDTLKLLKSGAHGAVGAGVDLDGLHRASGELARALAEAS